MRHMLTKLARVFRRCRTVGGDTRRLPSLLRAIKILAPPSVIKEVVASSSDRRQWGVLAAAWVGVSEREFMYAAARELGMPYQDHVPVPDLTVFGKNARAVLSALRTIGVTAQLQADRIVGFVVVDPAEVRGLELFDGTQSVCMASWSEIAKSLEMAERIIAESEANRDQTEALRRKDLCERILSVIINEAVQHHANNLDLLSLDGKTRYQFNTPSGKVAVGAIQLEAFNNLLLYLNTFEKGTLHHPIGGRMLVRALGSSSNLRLSWKHENYSTPDAPHDPPEVPNAASQIPVGAKGEPCRVLQDRFSIDRIPVLVIDDNPMFCRVLERLLKREQCEVSCVGNGVEALNRLTGLVTLLPRVIICDLHMPTMDGKEFVRKLKDDPRLKAIPVVMLTSDDGIDAELSMLEIGVEALISKSKDPRVLCAQVLRLAKIGSIQEAA